MLTQTLTLPEDPEELRSFTARLLAEVKAQAILIEKLRHRLAGHRAHRFGASSETAEQLQLALESSEIAAAAMTARMKLPDIEEKSKPKRRPIPDHIPRMEVELSPGADACVDCGGRLRRIGEDVTEELEYVPGRFIVNRIVRPRLTCACCERFIQAPLPSRPIERGRPGPGLLAYVLVSKYADHLPLYRQSQIFDREGLDLDRSTLADWVGKSTTLLEPLADAIGRYLAHGILELDNNAAERAMRTIALGRKNYLFVGSEAGGKAAAIAYTLIETAKLNEVDPHAWLADTVARIPDYKITKVDDLLPSRWNR